MNQREPGSEDEASYGDDQQERPAVMAEIVPVSMDTTALSALARTEVDAGLVWARDNPRSVARFLTEMNEFALKDAATAEKMYYSLRRGGKAIVGPSVRMAELGAECYGNLNAAARILSTSGEYAIAEGVAHDLERNTRINRTVARRLTDRNGRRYSDDMIVMTANAAGSLALRNAIVSVIGKRYLDPLVEAARKLVAGGSEGMADRREKALAWWETKGVSRGRVLAALGRKGAEDVTAEDLADLRGFARAIADNDATVAEVFPPLDTALDRLRARREPPRTASPVAVDGDGSLLWTALPAGDPQRAMAESMVAEMNGGNPVRIGLAMKRAKDERAFEKMPFAALAKFHEEWAHTKVAK